ncbi:MAG: hypothetical protein KDA66_05510 [Planctomycetaceae bacterium]|nr:hypothetical protein [Planctomycetaceae bacterium]
MGNTDFDRLLNRITGEEGYVTARAPLLERVRDLVVWAEPRNGLGFWEIYKALRHLQDATNSQEDLPFLEEDVLLARIDRQTPIGLVREFFEDTAKAHDVSGRIIVSVCPEYSNRNLFEQRLRYEFSDELKCLIKVSIRSHASDLATAVERAFHDALESKHHLPSHVTLQLDTWNDFLEPRKCDLKQFQEITAQAVSKLLTSGKQLKSLTVLVMHEQGRSANWLGRVQRSISGTWNAVTALFWNRTKGESSNSGHEEVTAQIRELKVTLGLVTRYDLKKWSELDDVRPHLSRTINDVWLNSTFKNDSEIHYDGATDAARELIRKDS